MNFRPFEPKSEWESRIVGYFAALIFAVMIVATILVLTKDPAPAAPVVSVQ